MPQSQEYRTRANAYAERALHARSLQERDQFRRMQRSYELLARSAEFDVSLNQLLVQLKG
jgi:hypothetical protein